MPPAAPAVRDKCGLFGVYGRPDAVTLCYLGLYAQQHRGQESAGLCSTDGDEILRYVGMGLVGDVFSPRRLEQLANPVAIGHVRYSTTGSNVSANVQPLLVTFSGGQVAVGHNGNLINASLLRQQYEQAGHIFSTTSDTEVILKLLADPAINGGPDPLGAVLRRLQGAFSLVFLFPDRIEAARDPFGVRPLCIGRLPDGAYVVASETCALDIADAEYVRDVGCGEIVRIDARGVSSRYYVDPADRCPAHCVFEHVYFADPSSDVFEQNVHVVREAMGRRLAREAPAEADVVIPVPNCARCAAMGYSQQSGMPLERGFTTNHYTGRSFIMPDQQQRDLAVKMKLNVIKDTVRGRRLVVVEDSIVRGTTTRGKMSALRRAGASEIHVRVASPPIRHPCHFGIDFPDPNELIANQCGSVEEIRRYLHVDSLAYLSIEGMLSCAAKPGGHYCSACFSGDYPMPVDRPVGKFILERHQMRMFD